MKRWISGAICMTVSLSVLSGCGSSGKDGQGTKINSVSENTSVNKDNKKIKLVYWGQDSGDTTKKELVAQFNNTHPNIEVQLEEIPWNAQHDKLIASLAAKSGPDIFDGKMIWLPELLGLNAVEDLTPYLDKWNGKNDIIKGAMDIVTTKDGKVYGLPYDLVSQILYYRKDIFKQAGLKPPSSYEELLETAKKLTVDTNKDGKIDQYGFGLRGGRFGHETWAAFVLSNMSEPAFFDKNNKPTFTNPEAVEANQFWLDMYSKHKVVPDSSITDSFNEIVGNLQSGVTAMTIGNIKMAGRLLPILGKDKLGAVPLPPGKNGKRINFVGDWESYMNIDIEKEKKEAGFTFIAWLSEKEQIKQWSKGLRSVPVANSLKNDPEYANDEFQQAAMSSLENAAIVPVHPKMGEWTENIWPQVTQKALLGQYSSQQMMEQLSKPFQ
jgi:multiple sugar transport system substrate-binding protein